MKESVEAMRARAGNIYGILLGKYPDASCSLDYRNPFELLVATILAAQCTDERVNMVTPALFAKYPDAAAMSKADAATLEKMIQSTGFFRNKTRSLLGMSKALVEEHGGRVPEEMDALTALPGVGRKTANVVRGNCFGKPAIIVDTHCMRLSGRLGFTKNTDPDKIEQDLMEIVPEKDWTMWSHLMVFHGRRTCTARKPACPECAASKFCPWTEKTT